MEDKIVIRKIIRWIVNIIILLSIAFLLSYTFLNQRVVQGHSMEDTLYSGDVLFLNRAKNKFFPIRRYDIICTEDRNIKRVIGLPGERLRIVNGSVYVNDIMLVSPHLNRISTPGLAKDQVIIQEDEYFVIGDNPDSSEDSRMARIGNIKKKNIEGTVWFVMLPINHIGIIR